MTKKGYIMLSKSCKLTCFYFTLLFSSIHPAIANETPSTPIVMYNFKVQQALSQADGRTKEAWLYNNQLPGPVIKVPKGTKLNINVQDHLKVPTSIHWHGMYQLGTWTMD